ncbi:MAG: glycosyltransferase family 4 protein [Saprospiraceae bacterium]|nr:glycosyltransferase family 4 protein [Saprospiraceae bacterium]
MPSNRPVLFIGNLPPPVNGQSLAFELAYTQYKGDKYLISQNFEGKNFWIKLIGTAAVCFRYLYFCWFKKPSLLYLVGSTSILGAWKDLFCIWCFSMRKVKVIVHIHGSGFGLFLNKYPSWIRNWVRGMYRKVSQFFILDEMMSLEYLSLGNDVVTRVVRNFYNPCLDDFTFTERSTQKIKIGYLSNIYYLKGIFVLLDAFEIIIREYPDLELHIAGKILSDQHLSLAECRKKFLSRVDGIPNVFYHGEVYGVAKCEFLNEANIFVFPSIHPTEGIPLSILEAFRSGCAVIASDTQYISALVTRKEGLCFKTGSVEDLVSCLRIFINDPHGLKLISSHNVDHAKTNFSPNQYIQSIENGIKEELNN